LKEDFLAEEKAMLEEQLAATPAEEVPNVLKLVYPTLVITAIKPNDT